MSSTSNIYEIKISFKKNGKNDLIYSSDIPYMKNSTNKDSLKIFSKEIFLICNRASKIKLDSIFYNHNSKLYNQIIKALVFYYSLDFNCPPIKEILIIRKGKNNNILDEKKLSFNSIIQPISSKINSNVVFDKNKIKAIFEENNKGKKLLIALSYWIKAMSTNDPIFIFERLWRSLNSIYSLIGNNQNETQNHIALRNLILTTPSIINKSFNAVNSYNATNLRNNYRWREMILNDYSTIKKTEAFKDFVLRYKDQRIISVLKQTLPYRKDFLSQKGLLTDVTDHININLSSPQNINAEIVCLLCIKYSYFIRNKYFHGEKLDGNFRLSENKEIKELKNINDIQSLFIYDLINENQYY